MVPAVRCVRRPVQAQQRAHKRARARRQAGLTHPSHTPILPHVLHPISPVDYRAHRILSPKQIYKYPTLESLTAKLKATRHITGAVSQRCESKMPRHSRSLWHATSATCDGSFITSTTSILDHPSNMPPNHSYSSAPPSITLNHHPVRSSARCAP